MPIDHYREFVLVADDVEKDELGIHGFTVQVFTSPAGEGQPQPRTVPSDLRRYLGHLERRKLDVDGVIGLGEALADLLLPDEARQLFIRSLDRLAPDQGLRLRLRLPPVLSSIPWEYAYIQRIQREAKRDQRGDGEKDATGFLALDPRVSIVRHESLPVSGDLDKVPKTRRLLVALASPEGDGYQPLDLAQEQANIEQALQGVPGMELDLVEPATVQRISDALLTGADVFHFAGHGVFQPTGLGTSFRSTVGEGSLVLVDDSGAPALVAADQLAVNLRGHGVQLVVLGACQTGRRDEENVWSGVVAALMEAEIPAAVAMQYKIWDAAAVAFSRSFYQALAVGLPLDQAVSAGRLAVFNVCHELRDDPQQGRFWRDWGVPVLYLRSGQDFVLPAIPDPDQRQSVAQGLRATLRHRFGEIGPRGRYVGVEAGVIERGKIESYLQVGRMSGEVTQVEAEEVISGEISAEGEADVVEGEWTGVRLGTVGGPSARARHGAGSRQTEKGPTCPNCGQPVEASAKFCPACGAELPTGPRFCTQCGVEISADAKFCPRCGTEVA